MFKNVVIPVIALLLIVILLTLSGNTLRNLQSVARSLWLRIAPPTVLIESFPASATLGKGESAATKDGKFLLNVDRADGTISVTTPLGTTKHVAIATKQSYNEIFFDGLYAVLVGYDYGDKVQFQIRELSSGLSLGSYADGITSITPSDGGMIPLKGVITLALNGSGSCNERVYFLDMVVGDGAGGGHSVVVPQGTCKPDIQEIPFEYDKTGKYHIFLVERISSTLKRTVEQKDVVVVGSSTSMPFVDLHGGPGQPEPRVAPAGYVASLSWDVSNVTHCTLINDHGFTQEKVSLNAAYFLSKPIFDDTTFTLQCVTDSGEKVSDSVMLRVDQNAPSCSLTITVSGKSFTRFSPDLGDPLLLTAGQPVNIEWESKKATHASGTFGSNLAVKGSKTFPDGIEPGLYQFDFVGPGGSARCDAPFRY